MLQAQNELLQIAAMYTSRPSLHDSDEVLKLVASPSKKSSTKDGLQYRPYSVLTQELNAVKQTEYLRYDRVEVLLLSWLEDDLFSNSDVFHPCSDSKKIMASALLTFVQIEPLENTFKTLGYNVRKICLRQNSKHSQQLQLNFAIAHFAERQDTAVTLQIVCYLGNAYLWPEGKLFVTR